jgi:hypothetical protein
MLALIRRSVLLGSLALLVFLTGCRSKPSGQQNQPAPAPAPTPPVLAPVGGPGAGIFKTIPAANREALAHDLKQIALAYRTVAIGGQPPQKAEDLGPDMRKQIDSINKGIYVIYWGLDPGRYPGNMVLGYAGDVPQNGGVVLTMDGSVTNMTVEEFKQAPKPR